MATEKHYPNYPICKKCSIPVSKLINTPREVISSSTNPGNEPLITIICEYKKGIFPNIFQSEKSIVRIIAGDFASPDVKKIDVSESCPIINWE